MESTEKDSEIRIRAEKRVNELLGFYVHLAVYILINIGLFVINYLTSKESWWFVWPLLGWGVGLFCHAIITFSGGLLSAAWKERKIKELIAKYHNENNVLKPSV
jgi:uncharacterized oligopeptide transporter (OPT) family protein